MYNKKARNVSLGKFVKSNTYKDDIITDPRGQWAHPGQNTRIPSNNITMKGVPYPVWAVPNVGEPIMMQPDQDYTFPGAQYVDEYPQMQKGGSVTAGPEYDSRYGLIGKVGYQNDFKGRDRSTERTLSGDVYGGAFGIGASGSYEFGTEQRGFPAKNFMKITVGGDKVRGAYGDLTAGSKIHAIQDRQNELNITPFGGVSMQTKASELAMPGADMMGSRVGLNYGLGADYTRKFKNDSSLNLYGQMMGNPVLGKFTDRQSYDSEKLSFAPQFTVGAKFTLPLNSDSRKIKAIMAKQQEDKASPFALNSTTSRPSFQDGGEYEDLELTDEEIQAYRDAGYIVEDCEECNGLPNADYVDEFPQMQRGGPVTTKDSTNLYNNSVQLKSFYDKNSKYYEKPKIRSGWHFDNNYMKAIESQTLGNSDLSYDNTKIIQGNKDKNISYMSDMITPMIDPAAPLLRYDHRIKPQGSIDYTPKDYFSEKNLTSSEAKLNKLFESKLDYYNSYALQRDDQKREIKSKAMKYAKSKGFSENDVKALLYRKKLKEEQRIKLPGNITTLPYYDPIQIKPWHMLTEDEKRIRRGGSSAPRLVRTLEPLIPKPLVPELPTRPLQGIPQEIIPRELIQRPKENMTGKVKPPQDAAQWIKHPQTGTWYQKQRPVRPEYLESRRVGFLQKGGVNPYYTSRFDDPRIQQYKDSAESWNRGSELYLNDPNQSWANSQADLDDEGIFHPLMPDSSLFESYRAALLPDSPSLSFYKPKQKVIYNKPAKPMQLPTRPLQGIPQEIIPRELIQRPEKDMSGTVKPPQQTGYWVKDPRTGTTYFKERPVKPQYLESRRVGFLQNGGQWNQEAYNDSVGAYNFGLNEYLATWGDHADESTYKKWARLAPLGPWTNEDTKDSYYDNEINKLKVKPITALWDDVKTPVYRKPVMTKAMWEKSQPTIGSLPTRKLTSDTSRELVQQTFPETAPIKPMELAYRNQTNIDAEGKVTLVKVPYAAKDNGQWDLLDSPRVIDQRKQSGGQFIEMELTDEEIQQYRDGGYVVEDLPKAQNGLDTDKEFLKSMANSPLFEERYSRMTGDTKGSSKFKESINNNLDTLKADYEPGFTPSPFMFTRADAYYAGSPKAWKNTGFTNPLTKEEMKDYSHSVFTRNSDPSNRIHEISHGSTRGLLNLENPFKFSNKKEIDPKYFNDNGEEYFTKPTEIKARVDAVRKYMKDANVYDATTQPFTEKEYDYLQKTISEPTKGPWSGYKNQMEELLNPFDKEEVIRMFNDIVQTDSKGGLTKAQDGKEIIVDKSKDEVEAFAYAKAADKERWKSLMDKTKALMNTSEGKKLWKQEIKPKNFSIEELQRFTKGVKEYNQEATNYERARRKVKEKKISTSDFERMYNEKNWSKFDKNVKTENYKGEYQNAVEESNAEKENNMWLTDTALEFTGAPALKRISQDPIGTAEGVGQTIADVASLPKGLTEGVYNYATKGDFNMGKNILGQNFGEGLDETLDVLGVLPGIGSAGKLARAGKTGDLISDAGKLLPRVPEKLPEFQKFDEGKRFVKDSNITGVYNHTDLMQGLKEQRLTAFKTNEGRKRLQAIIDNTPQLKESGITVERYIKGLEEMALESGKIKPTNASMSTTYTRSAKEVADKTINLSKVPSGDAQSKLIIGNRLHPDDAKIIGQHELGHFVQQKGLTNLDRELQALKLIDDSKLAKKQLSITNKTGPKRSSWLNKINSDYYGDSTTGAKRYWEKGSKGREKLPFMEEVRADMLQKGLIDDLYSPISDKLLRNHYDDYMSKSLLDKYPLRVYDIAEDVPENFSLMKSVLNRMAVGTGVAATAAGTAEYKKGGEFIEMELTPAEIKQYKKNGYTIEYV